MDFYNRPIPTYTDELQAQQDIARLTHEGFLYLANVVHLQFAVLVGVIILIAWIRRSPK